MPYFVYRIDAEMKLTNLGSHETYRDAKNNVRSLREQSADPGVTYRLIHAQNENQAEILLLTPREKPVEGDD
jgi:hypothetical protein